jgi:hypothetical protein
MDDWDNVCRINMYGCDQFGYDTSLHTSLNATLTDDERHSTTNYDDHYTMGYLTFYSLSKDCTQPAALGYLAAAFFLVVVLFGGMVRDS